MGSVLVDEYISPLPACVGWAVAGSISAIGYPLGRKVCVWGVGGAPYLLPAQGRLTSWGVHFSYGGVGPREGGRKLARDSPLFDGRWRLPVLPQDSTSRFCSSWGGGSFWPARVLGQGKSAGLGL